MSIGSEYKDAWPVVPGPWSIGNVTAFGELPCHENKMHLIKQKGWLEAERPFRTVN